jgi:hypothetical protein
MHSPYGDGLEAVTNGNEVVRVPQVVLLLRHQLRSTTVSQIRSNKATHWTPAVGSALDPAPQNKANPTSNRSARTESIRGGARGKRTLTEPGPLRTRSRWTIFIAAYAGERPRARLCVGGLRAWRPGAGESRRAARGWESLFRNYLTADMVTKSIARSYGWLSLRSLSLYRDPRPIRYQE